MSPVEQHIEQKLQERIAIGNLRTLKTGRAQVDFFSNDYLGLATNNVLSVGSKVTGATGSRLLSGNSTEAELLEKKIAAFHHAEAALLFNSGYDANTGLLACVANRHTTILYDELCHASIIDGIKLSQAQKQYKFRHNDVADLRNKLERQPVDTPIIIAVESVYSMDGDIAPLKELAAISEEYNAVLIVDEAHATGVFGDKGKGLVCESRIENKVFARVHTFGKALGCQGAAVVCGDRLKQYLINFARPFIYTTALPPYCIEAAHIAYDHLSQPDFSNKHLHDLVDYFRNKIKDSGSNQWKDSYSPIQALVIGDNTKAKTIASALQQTDLQVNPILHPTVPIRAERLRICLHTFNTTEQIDTLFDTLNSVS